MLRPQLPQSKRARILLALGAFVALCLVVIIAQGGLDETKQMSADPMAGVTVASEPTVEKHENDPQSQLILELFNPSDQSLTDQVTLTTITQQVEQALTVSYVLTKCQLISQDDYTQTFRALIVYVQEMKIVDSEAKAEALVRHIAESAGASYSLVYSRLSCRDPKLQPLAQQLTQWTHAIMARTQ